MNRGRFAQISWLCLLLGILALGTAACGPKDDPDRNRVRVNERHITVWEGLLSKDDPIVSDRIENGKPADYATRKFHASGTVFAFGGVVDESIEHPTQCVF